MSTKREHFNGIFTLKKRMTKEKRRANVNIMIRQKDPKNHSHVVHHQTPNTPQK